MRADRTATCQFPGAGGVAKRLGRQCPDRADVNHVAREFGLDGTPDKRGDFGVFATVKHAQFHDTGDFLTETHTARAVNAARHFFGGNKRAHFFMEHDALFFLVTRACATVPHRQVLQLALAALIADGAVKRVIDQQELHDAFLCRHCFFRARVHDHAIGYGRGAGRHGLGRLFDVNQAHATVRRDGEFLVIAKVRHIQPQFVGRMHDHAAFGDFDLFAVDGEFNH